METLLGKKRFQSTLRQHLSTLPTASGINGAGEFSLLFLSALTPVSFSQKEGCFSELSTFSFGPPCPLGGQPERAK